MSNEQSHEELEKAARALCFSIIDSSFEYPNSKDKLFVDSSYLWSLNACIDKFNGINAYATGYLDAAKLLARIVIYSRSKMDTLVYPIIYLYRHYLEIKLKDLIRQGANITDSLIDEKLEQALGEHNLMVLWNRFKPFFEAISGHNDSFNDVKKGMESYINQIHSIDPASFTFRYDRPKNSTVHNLDKIERINLFHFCQNMEKLTGLIEGIDCEFHAALDWINEMR
jgi:hypothetical protein